MRSRRVQSRAGVTMLELLITIFVLLIGMVGIMGLFPVGVRLSRQSSVDIVGAMTAQIGLAAVRVEHNLLDHLENDVLGWDGDEERAKGVDGIIGNVAKTAADPAGGLADFRIEANLSTADYRDNDEIEAGDGSDENRALMLMTSGRAQWKVYRLSRAAGAYECQVADFPADGVEPGDQFRLIGARCNNHVWATVPAGFFDNPPHELGTGAAQGYGYLAIVSQAYGLSNAYRVDVLVYQNYDSTLPPEANRPAVGCYTTIISGDMLR